MRSKLLSLIFLLSLKSWCQNPGELDTSFDGDGRVFTTFVSTTYINWSRAVAVDATRIYLAGSASDGSGNLNKLSCIAYNLNGTPDSSFAANGKFQFSWPFNASATDIKMQPDGKILLLGQDYTHLLIIRLNHDGSIDDTWAQNGVAEFDASETNDESCRIALQHDGKVIISGSTNAVNPEIFVARLTKDGIIDPSFGVGGKYGFTMSNHTGHLRNLALQPDDKIIISFDEGIVMNNLSYLLRLTAEGILDIGFNTTGYIMNTGFSGYRAMAVTENGAIYAAASQNGTVVRRFGIDGALDNGFNATAAYSFAAKDLFIKDGKIMLLGYTGMRPFTGIVTEDYAAIVFNIDGIIDTNFGTNGIAWVDMGSEYDTAQQGAIQPDGKLLITGNGLFKFTACRLNAPAYLSATAFGKPMAGLSPNPSHDGKFNIRLSQKFRHIKVSIANTLGQQVKAAYFYGSDNIEMKIEENGIFFVTITADGQNPITLKLLRQ
jgi:uncharacterized delta-60 repeat protein